MSGKRALITGAGSGIGRALAIEASRLGMTVALCGRRGEALNATLSLMTPGKDAICACAATSPIRPSGAGCATICGGTGVGLDVLVNNAGIVPSVRLLIRRMPTLSA